MTKEKLTGEATPEQIEQWKAKYGKVYAVKVGGHVAYLRKPDRKVLGAAASILQKDPIKANETILNNCFIGGSEEIKTDDDLFFGASSVIMDIIKIQEAELVNL